VQKILLFLLMSFVRLIAKIGASDWYRETQRVSGKSPKAFAFGAIISVAFMLVIAVVALAAHL
jgi:uncharacterized membrane protein YidH (DUF202 family)